jgi:amino acid adenylation domain-containing protein
MTDTISENLLLSGARFAVQKEYWNEKLSGDIHRTILLPEKKKEKDGKPSTKESIEIPISNRLGDWIIKISKNSNLSVYLILLTALKILIYRYTENNNNMIISPVYLPKKTGETLNDRVIIRSNLTDGETFKQQIIAQRQAAREAYENQDYPYRKILENLWDGDSRKSSRKSPETFDGIYCAMENIHNEIPAFREEYRLGFIFGKNGGGLQGDVHYDPAIFDAPDIQMAVRHFIAILEAGNRNLDVPVADISIMTPWEHEQLKKRCLETSTQQRDSGNSITENDVPLEAPGDAAEEKLQLIWADILEKEPAQIGIHDNFFESGGHSLQAIMLVTKLHKEFNVGLTLEDVFKNESIRKQAELIKQSGEEYCEEIQPAEQKDYYPMSSAQERMYVLQQMEPDIVTYNMPQMIPLAGEIDRAALQRAATELLRRHESLRTTFHLKNKNPIQRIQPPSETVIEIEYYKGSDKPGSENHPVTLYRKFVRYFDLSEAPLLRAGVIEMEDGGNILLLDMHHIISDAASRRVLARDFAALYGGETLPPLRLQYKDYTRWQNSEKQREVLKKQEQYWLEHFDGEIPVLEIPRDFPRPQIKCFEGGAVGFALDTETSEALKELARKENATGYMLLLAAYTVLLSKLSGNEDIVVGTPVAGRRHADLEPIIGMFVNTLAIRNRPEGEKHFGDYLGEVKQRTLEGFENQEFPLEELVEKAGVVRNAGRNPLFDAVFTWRGLEGGAVVPETGGNADEQTEYRYEDLVAKFDLTLTAVEQETRLAFNVEYGSGLFKAETILRFTRYYKAILKTILEDPRIPLKEIEIVGGDERQRLLRELNQTETAYPMDKTLHFLFEEQTALRPDHTALVVGWTEQTPVAAESMYRQSLTYSQLNRKARQLAILLRERGVRPDTIVALKMEGALQMMVGILGILKAGGAYLPIDPATPQERIDYMLKDSAAGIIVTEGTGDLTDLHGTENREEQTDIDIIYLDSMPPDTDIPALPPDSTPGHWATQLCYVIYTSGSTGKPKGTLTTHRNAVRVVKDTNYIDITPEDRVLQLSNYAFDGSVFDIFGALLNGAALVTARESGEVRLDRLPILIEREMITVFFVTTALFNTLVDIGLEQLRWVRKILFGGERVSVEHTRKALTALGRHQIIHMYGPTETTVYATYYPVNHITGTAATIPIGRPLANTTLYILDKHMKLVPEGVTGELYIGGDSVCRGYMNNPVLTMERFTQNPYRQNERLYRSGDLGRWQADGNIEFIGRQDRQVKVRGYRVELGEIENRLLKHRHVKEAVVVERRETSGELALCAYIVPRDNDGDVQHEWESIKNYLSEQLPAFMLPSYVVGLEKLPLNANGKLNRNALPDPGMACDKDRRPPRDLIEKKMAGLWADVLGIAEESIGIDDDFFELGGHSLKATVLTSKIHQAFDVKIPLAAIFSSPTVEELARTVRQAETEKYSSVEPVEERDYYHLSPAQKRLFFLHRMRPESIAYNMPEVIPLPVGIDQTALKQTVNRLIRRHESFRTTFHLNASVPIQKIHSPEVVQFEPEIFENQNKITGAPHLREIMYRDFVRPFDLSCAPLLRVGVMEGESGTAVLLVDMHHIISDGVSHGILVRDFTACMQGETLPSLRLQYRDYAQWQNSERHESVMKAQEAFWLKRFEDDVPVLCLPLDNVRPEQQTFEGEAVGFAFPRETARRLKIMAQKENATVYMAVLAVYTLLLSKLSGQEDVVVGTSVAGRRHADLQQIIGMFVNTLALRNNTGGDKTLAQYLGEVRNHTLEAFENQEYPFETLVEKVCRDREISRNPLFDVMLSWQNMETGREEYAYGNRNVGENSGENDPGNPPDKSNIDNIQRRITKFDLVLAGMETGQQLIFELRFNRAMFRRATILQWVEYFKQLADVMANQPERRIPQLDTVPPADMEYIAGVNRRGKRQTAQLLQPEETSGDTAANEIREPLTDIWADILELEPDEIEPDGNFFQQGGHSLQAIMLVTKIHKAFDIRVPLEDVFKHPTINEMALYLTKRKDSVEERYASIQPVEQMDYYPLSSAQKRLYILQQMEPGIIAYNMPQMVPLAVDYEPAVLEQTVRKLIARHESLRTAFRLKEEEPVQEIQQPDEISFEIEYHREIREKSGPQTIFRQFVRPFELSEAPLLRVGVIEMEAGGAFLMVDMHHIISDATSRRVLVKDFTALYSGETLPPLRLQYRDYTQWQHGEIQWKAVKKQEKYWHDRLEGDIPVLELPYDFLRPPIQQFDGGEAGFALEKETADALNRLALKENVTRYMLMLAAFTVLLSKLGGSEDIIVGTPVAGRRHADLEHIMGMFVNTLPLRNFPEGDKSFLYYLGEVKQATLAAFENQEYPLEELVETIGVERDAGRNPFFDIVFRYRKLEQQAENRELPGEDGFESGDRVSKFDLTFTAVELSETLMFNYEYRTGLFEGNTIKRFNRYLKIILETVLENPGILLNEIELLKGEERRNILEAFNRTGASYPEDKTLHRLFEDRAASLPDHAALVGRRHGNVDNGVHPSSAPVHRDFLHVTYREINTGAGELARRLRGRGVGEGTVVAIKMEPSIQMAQGILGILKAGAAYLPVAWDTPGERVDFMLKDSAARLLVTVGPVSADGKDNWILETPNIENDSSPLQDIGQDRAGGADEPAHRYETAGSSVTSGTTNSRLCYVIYTSGTTGRPKGVMVEHRSIVNTLQYRKNLYRLDSRSTVLQLFSFAFDGFLAGFFTPLISGARLIQPGRNETGDIDEQIAWILREQVTHFIAVPPLFHRLITTMTPKEAESLQAVTLAGDKVLPGILDAARRKNPLLEIVNEYGVTEGSVLSTLFRHQEKHKQIVEGSPIRNTTVYILDKYLRPLPVGVAGELCIGGAGVARGYMNSPELTAERFVIGHPVLDLPENGGNPVSTGSRLYRTGDRARWRQDGVIEILGRMDFQVKLRGYRIEPGEIERRLMTHPRINEAVVEVVTQKDGDKALCAYFVPQLVPQQGKEKEENEEKDDAMVTEVREYLSDLLPGYMVPSYFVPLGKMPLTPIGKLDRKALPAPGIGGGMETYTPPQNDTEKLLVRIWAAVLGIEEQRIGIDENFFQMGGHSLKATRLTAAIHRTFHVKLPLVEIFANPTIRQQARAVKTAVKTDFNAIEPVEKKEFYAMSSAQKRIFALQTFDKNGLAYNMPMFLRLEQDLDLQRMETAFHRLIARHESLRTAFYMKDEEYMQRVYDAEDVPFTIDYTDKTGSDRTGTPLSGEAAMRNFIKPFDLRKAPLIRVSILREAERRYMLMVDMHHIISDEASHKIYMRDFQAIYNGKELPPLRLQYKDFTEWQIRWMETSEKTGQEQYWHEIFKNDAPPLIISDYQDENSTMKTGGKMLRFETGKELNLKIKRHLQEYDVTLYMFILAAYNIMLAKYGNSEDIVIGSPVSGRSHGDLHDVIGIFVNMIAMRNHPHPGKSFAAFQEEVRQNALEGFDNQDYPFDRLVEYVARKRDVARYPLDAYVFVLNEGNDRNGESRNRHNSGDSGGGNESAVVTPKFDLTLGAVQERDTIAMDLQYRFALFTDETVDGMSRHLINIMEAAVNHPAVKIADIEMLDEEERAKILESVRIDDLERTTEEIVLDADFDL